MLRRIRRISLVLCLLAIAPATASAACGDTITDDYLDDGRVDGRYSQGCFDAALAGLDADLREYTNAEADILAAKISQRPKTVKPATPTDDPPRAVEPAAATNEPAPASPSDEEPRSGSDEPGASAPPSDAGTPPPDPVLDEVATPPLDDVTTEEQIVDAGGVLGVQTELAEPAATADGPLQQALRDVGPTGGDELPLPVMVLGGLAVLLIAVGAGGIVLRRLQSR